MGNYTGKLVVAKKSFGYGGSHRDIGEVFTMLGLRNDDRIYGLDVKGNKKTGRYTEPFKRAVEGLPRCSVCGATFSTLGRREQHYELRHKE